MAKDSLNKLVLRLLISATLIAGIFLRCYHLLRFDFQHAPYRLGGLFVAFAEQISTNGFRLPVNIPFYSEGGIPFAYPPFGFYVEAVLLRTFPASRFLVANLLPPAISILAFMGVFLLFRWHFSGNAVLVLAGTFAYAFLPSSFANQVEAAGLAESFGSLALTLFFYTALRFRARPVWTNALWFGLALAFAVLCSLGSAIGAALLAGLLGLETVLKHRFRLQALGATALAAVTGLAVSAPYWLTVIIHHGRGIFIMSVLGQYQDGSKRSFLEDLFQRLMNFTVTQDGGFFFWNLVIFLGLLWLILHDQWALPLTFLALFSIPRESVWLLALPAAWLFAYGFTNVLLPLARPTEELPNPLKHWGLTLLTIFMGGWLALQSFALSNALRLDQQWSLSAEQITQIEAARSLIPQEAKVLVLGNDALLEWAPYLLQREVINTKFGLEWQPAKLEKVTLLNKQLERAVTLNDVLNTVNERTDLPGVYILSSDKKYLTALSRDSSAPFKMKWETSEIQISVLGAP